MSTAQSPAVFNGEVDNFYDQNYEMSNKMKLPKTLRVSDEFKDDDSSRNDSAWVEQIPNNIIDMHMPDRILVVGHDQHVGLKAPPIEMTLENSIIPPEHTMTRVQTPPRVLTLGDHFFPTFDDESIDDYGNITATNSTTPVISNGAFVTETRVVNRNIREETPVWNNTLDVSLAQSDEVQHLRRQLGKLNRRVMAVESVMYQRQQRDKYIYAITVAYFLFKAFNWITRN